MKHTVAFLLVALFITTAHAQLRVGVAGLNHDHVYGLMEQYKKGKVIIVGIAEPDTALAGKWKRRYGLADNLFYPSVATMLANVKPDAVLAYNPIEEHLSVVEACAPQGVSVMVEKPLAVSVAQADKIESLVKQYHIHVLVNYETTWYPTNQQVYTLAKNGEVGQVRKMVAHDGHQGPKEIGCSQDFLKWLTDPVKNGGGAVVDFGCYGANLMTWMMGNQKPLAVTAVLKHYKPDVYPKVDDDATIMVEWPGAVGLIEGSWNWPFSIKDWEVFGDKGYLHAMNNHELQERKGDGGYKDQDVPAYTVDNLTYLADVLSGKINPDNDLSGLPNNLIVVRILEAAKRSAKEGKRIEL
ncbi:Gfo/Idh/MocA family protein [Dinghuibacter silviterrae]|uniref:Putative dehydrogenase n=1 Tax=Dinghuibacter silviterrae TaxID=1539049 RepID=A0A4R8DRB6_9BACT|nr:Gfo/Idh/MocA family oxidoreductase [Dinghuibacter silviterrae]TDX00348.1 putative dehydrogenase [Dinghuibacter silviterrae]